MSAPYVVVASLLKHDAMCSLFFTHLESRAPIRIVQYGRDPLAAPLAGASALVVIRGLFEFGSLVACARKLGVPCYYFLDDNFMLIREEAERYGSSYDRYTNERVRDTLADYAGVLLAADSLIDYFREHNLHQHAVYYPPVAGPVLAGAASPDTRPLSVAFFGGAHRREPFRRMVFPALSRLASRRPVRVIAAGIEPRDLAGDPNIDLVALPYNPSFEDALRAVAETGADILVHPSEHSTNNVFKNPHVLINARAIGATPIFSAAPPYEHVEAEGIALTAGDSVDAWFSALQRLDDRDRRSTINARLDAYCNANFGGDRNLAIIGGMLARHSQPTRTAAAARTVVAGACLTAGRVRSRLTSRPQH